MTYNQTPSTQTINEGPATEHTGEHAGAALSRAEWDEIARRLREPFDPKEVDFRVQGRASEATGKAQVVAYIDARAVQDRLDNVVGAGNWAFDWTPLVIDNGEVQVAKGTLAVYGVAKSDAGSASNFEQSLGAVSHCFKRAAVHWGIGRYLYNLPMAWVAVERGGRISEATLNDLRGRLPKPSQPAGAKPIQANMNSHAPEAPARPAERPAPAVRPTERPSAPTLAARPAAPVGAGSRQNGAAAEQPAEKGADKGEALATEQQVASIRKLHTALGKPEPEAVPGLTFAQAKQAIIQLSGEYQRARKAS